MSKHVNNALLISVAITLLAWQGLTRAQEANIGTLLPVILLVLDDDQVQCPSIPELPVFIGGFPASGSPVEFSPNVFSPGDLGDFLSGVPTDGVGTTAADIADVLSSDASVTQFQGDVDISTQEGIDELEGVVQITGSLSVSSASLLQELDFSPLNSLVQIRGSLSFNTSNSNIRGFQCLATVGGDLTFRDNDSLRSIGGFQSLESTGFSLNVISNNSLESIGGFQLLDTISGNLNLANNPNLENLGSLARLNRVDVLGDIIIAENTVFDCSDPESNFVTATRSSGNAVNCAQDLLFRNLGVANSQALSIPDLGSVTSAIPISNQLNVGGLVQSLRVNLDITHTSVGDLTITLSNGTTTVNLLAEPTELVDGETLSAAIANECIDTPFEDGFLNEVIIDGSGNFESFNSIDAACALELTETLTGETCRSNDIVVSLLDSPSLLPINASCSSNDSAVAFTEPLYSPAEPLSVFQGNDVNGTWTLSVTDSKNGNIGSLNSWGIIFEIER